MRRDPLLPAPQQSLNRRTARETADYSEDVRATLATLLHEVLAVKEMVAEACQRRQEEQKDWYCTSEVAAALGVSQHTVQERWCNQGRIACEKDPDTGKWRIPGHELQRIVKGGGLRPGKKM
jgi:hypothetical protein